MFDPSSRHWGRQRFVRTLGAGIAGASLAPLASGAAASAAGFPDHPVTFIVPWGPGGGSDQMARALQAALVKALGQPLAIEDDPGGTGTVGLEKMMGALADGYTVGDLIADTLARVAGGGSAWKMSEVVGVARLMNVPSFLFTHSQDSRFKSWEDLASYAKAHAGELKCAMTGIGSVDDMTLRYLATKGYKFTGVPYPEPSERYAALLGRHVDLLYEQAGDVHQYVTGGQFRPLIIFAEKALPALPKVPPCTKYGLEIFLPQFRGIIVREGTDPAAIATLEKAFKAGFYGPQFQKYTQDQFMYPDSFMPRAQFDPFLKTQYTTMVGYLKQFGMLH